MFSQSSQSFWASALLTLLNIWAWADTRDMSIKHPVSLVTATIGGSVILECRSKADLPSGPVKWYKGTGPVRELVFSDKGSFSRVQKVYHTNRVWKIRISNITSQDEGVYYCIKFKKSPETELSNLGGTRLIVVPRQSQGSSGVPIAATAGSLSLILIFLVLCCYFKRWKDGSPCLARSKASKKNQPQEEPTENNESIYTDLQPIGKNHESEYETIHFQ